MHRNYILAIISALLSVSSWAQENSARQEYSCNVVPVFHCVRHLDRGGAIGYFGYDLHCSHDAPADAEVYIDINEDNLFSPGSQDRGQPKIFVSGQHLDEFEVDFSKAEVEGSAVIYWSVLGRTAMVDLSKTKDDFMDCSTMSR